MDLRPTRAAILLYSTPTKLSSPGRKYSNGMDVGPDGTGIFKPDLATQDVTAFTVASMVVTPILGSRIVEYNLEWPCRRDIVRIE